MCLRSPERVSMRCRSHISSRTKSIGPSPPPGTAPPPHHHTTYLVSGPPHRSPRLYLSSVACHTTDPLSSIALPEPESPRQGHQQARGSSRQVGTKGRSQKRHPWKGSPKVAGDCLFRPEARFLNPFPPITGSGTSNVSATFLYAGRRRHERRRAGFDRLPTSGSSLQQHSGPGLRVSGLGRSAP